MKITMRILGVAAVLAVAALAIPTANASCIPSAQFSTWGNGGYFYVNLPAGANNSTIVGKFWAKGNFGSGNSGSYDDSQWLKLYAPTNKWYISGATGDPGIAGCPSGSNMIIQLDNADGKSLTLESIETPGTAVRWDYSTLNTDFSFADKPRPRVGSSSRSGSSVNVTMNLTAQSGGTYGPQGAAVAAVPSYQLVVGTGAADPGSAAANYVAVGPIVPGTPLPTSVDCTNTAVDKWLAVQTFVDGQGSSTVSARTRIECDPTLADPDFKHIDRPGRPNPRSGR
jgi:hypothetical protein